MSDTAAGTGTPKPKSPFVPLLLLGIAVVVSMLYETVQLLGERVALAELKISQIQPLKDSQKLRAALGSFASRTQRLADAGDPSARLLVDELRKRGITIDPDAAPPPPPR
jgi:hypothetical protein